MSFRAGHYFSLENNSSAENTTENQFQSIDFSEMPLKSLTSLWKETLEKSMHGICFSL